MADQIFKLWPYLVGYGYALLIGQLCIRSVMECAYKKLRHPSRPEIWLSSTLGAVECSMFIAAILYTRPEFIAFWLGLKVAVQWRRWTDTGGSLQGRQLYNLFLLGNALVVIFAFTGAKMIEWLNAGALAKPLLGGAGLVVSLGLLRLVLGRITPGR